MSIEIRKPKFDFNNVPKNWYKDNPVLTAFWNSFSLTFPEGEKFFVKSVKYYEEQTFDELLKSDIKSFIGQEAQHGKQHRAFNKMLKSHGYSSVDELESVVVLLLKTANKILTPEMKLAVTCALEHFTALLGEQLLTDEQHQLNIDSSIKDLWMWHALEEIEHKSVAYNVYIETKGTYFIRILTMIVVSAILSLAILSIWTVMLSDKEIKSKDVFEAYECLFSSANGLFPKLTKQYMDYFHPSFHPSWNRADNLIKTWKEKLYFSV